MEASKDCLSMSATNNDGISRIDALITTLIVSQWWTYVVSRGALAPLIF